VRILHRYILREIATPFLLGLSVFTFLLLVARLLKLIELVVTRGVPAGDIIRLLGYIMPAFLEVTVPMALLLAVLVSFGRLSADSELVALRSSGLSLYQLMAPVAIVVGLATLATAMLSIHVRPWGNRSVKAALFDIARTRASAGLKAHVFNDDFPGLVIYADTIEAVVNRLHHVLVSDEREPDQHHRIFARQGTMVSDPEAQVVTLRLRDGFIHTMGPDGGPEYQTDFQSYDVSLDLRDTLATVRQGEEPKELTLGELRAAIAAKRAAGLPFTPELVEYHRKFSIPFACVVFGLVAVPLGLQPVRAARSRGFAVSVVLIFGYYVLLSLGEATAEYALVPAVVGLWLPNVVFAALGTYLFRRAARERAVMQFERLGAALTAVRHRLGMGTGAEAAR
jgi:lipopolysaccharide export system permease protein